MQGTAARPAARSNLERADRGQHAPEAILVTRAHVQDHTHLHTGTATERHAHSGQGLSKLQVQSSGLVANAGTPRQEKQGSDLDGGSQGVRIEKGAPLLEGKETRLKIYSYPAQSTR